MTSRKHGDMNDGAAGEELSIKQGKTFSVVWKKKTTQKINSIPNIMNLLRSK